MKNFKKAVLALLLVSIVSVSTTMPVLAQTDTYQNLPEIKTFTYNLTEEDYKIDSDSNLNSFDTRSVAWPSNVWDISSKGQYNFGGVSSLDTLYTNYLFKGRILYNITVENTGPNPITVQVKKSWWGFPISYIVVPAGKGTIFQLTNIKESDKFAISFSSSGKYSFKGNIR